MIINYSAISAPRRRALKIIGLVVIIMLAFGSGYSLGNVENGSGQIIGKNSPAPSYLNHDVDFDLFWNVWDMLQKKYVDQPILDTKLFYGALSGLVAGVGDPYTVFLDPKTAKDFSEELSGSFEGIGAEIGLRDNQIVVIAPLKDTPAAKSGVEAGDAILAIDGVDTANMMLEEAVAAIRGEKDTTVTLTLRRAGKSEPFDIAIVRSTIIIQSVEFSMKASVDNGPLDVAYIHITNFNEDTAHDFRLAVNEALKNNPRAVLLDLRNNPGGFLETAVEVASEWVSDGPIVIQQSASGEKTPYPSKGYSSFKGVKTLVLVNGGSASASEIVAGALQDYELATIVGSKTFGKGSVQELDELRDGSALKITIAKWLTPDSRSIDQEGIAPDVLIEPEKDADPAVDTVLKKALEILDNKK